MEKDYAPLNTTLINSLKKKIAELKESEGKFRAIFENARDGILLADAETKKFVLANPMICEMTGYGKEEILTLSVEKIHPKKDLQHVLEQFAKQLQGKISLAKDLPVLRKDRTVIYCDINSASININDKEMLVGFFRDATEQKKMIENLSREKDMCKHELAKCRQSKNKMRV